MRADSRFASERRRSREVRATLINYRSAAHVSWYSGREIELLFCFILKPRGARRSIVGEALERHFEEGATGGGSQAIDFIGWGTRIRT